MVIFHLGDIGNLAHEKHRFGEIFKRKLATNLLARVGDRPCLLEPSEKPAGLVEAKRSHPALARNAVLVGKFFVWGYVTHGVIISPLELLQTFSREGETIEFVLSKVWHGVPHINPKCFLIWCF